MTKLVFKYIVRLAFAVALIGHTACDKKPKNAEVVDPSGGGGGPGGSAGASSAIIDPTSFLSDVLTLSIRQGRISKLSDRREVFTGAQFNDELYYTDGAFDNLISNAQSDLQDKDDDEIEGDSVFARQLSITQVVLNPAAPKEITVNLKYKKTDVIVPVVLSGTIEKRRATLIGELTIITKCIESDGTCFTVALKIIDKSVSPERVAYGIFRSIPVDVKFEYIKKVKRNGNWQDREAPELPLAFEEEYSPLDYLYELLENGNKEDAPALKEVAYETAAIVNGASNFSLFMRMHRDEGDTTLVVFGPLVKADGTTELDLDLREFVTGLVLKEMSAEPLAAKVIGVSLLQNDGRGKIQVQLKFGSDQRRVESMNLLISSKNPAITTDSATDDLPTRLGF